MAAPTLRGRHALPPDEVGARIKAERLRLGHSLHGAARLLGIHHQSLRNLERNANPQLSTLIALVTVLGMDPRAIVPELFEAADAPRD